VQGDVQLFRLAVSSRDTKFVGYGIPKTRARKRPALPSSKTFQSKSIFFSSEPNLGDSIHFRVPEIWRGKIKSKRVRKWFTEFLEGREPLAEVDPGPGSLEVSVRISRRELNAAAKRYQISSAVLLRRLIAVQLGEGRPERKATQPVPIRSATLVSAPDPLTAWLKKVMAPAPVQAQPVPLGIPNVPNTPKRLNFVTHVEGVRSLQEIDRAKRRGEGITFEELLRWRAVFERR
jgi:hypothetical protein